MRETRNLEEKNNKVGRNCKRLNNGNIKIASKKKDGAVNRKRRIDQKNLAK